MKLYTKRGDDGTTGLIGGERVAKDSLRVTAYGDVDETNAVIGLATTVCDDNDMVAALLRIQADLFTIGAELATPDGSEPSTAITENDIVRLEGLIDVATNAVEPLKVFILPGGCELASRLHVARTVCRRGERSVVTLGASERVRPIVVKYLNRLSDLLFALARHANRRADVEDLPWTPGNDR